MKRGSQLGFTFEDVEPENATRYKFDPRKNDFAKDTVKLKIQGETMVTELPGATRVLFRCKVPPQAFPHAAGQSRVVLTVMSEMSPDPLQAQGSRQLRGKGVSRAGV